VKGVKLLVLAVLGIVVGCLPAAVENDIAVRARAIHERILTVDTHCDSAFNLLRPDWKIGERHEPGLPGSGQIDLPRMAEGGLDAEFFAVFVGQGPRTAEGNAAAKAKAMTSLEAVLRMERDYPGLVGIALTPEDAIRLKKSGRRAAFVGMENGYPIGTDLSLVEAFYKLGVRCITLCHSRDNDICDSSTDGANPRDDGLSEFGRRVVAECNRLGVLVDVSHASDRSFSDILGASRAPVIASHSCARALCDNPRNLSDDMLRALAAKGGVMQLCFLSAYVRKPKPNPARDSALKALEARYGKYEAIKDEAVLARLRKDYEEIDGKYPEAKATVAELVDHIDHVIKVAGIEHIGIGTDFDGGGGVDGCDDVSQMIRVTEELLRRGYSEPDIGRIWGGNFLRVFGQAIETARKAVAVN
jgi:membrane dipeptidase